MGEFKKTNTKFLKFLYSNAFEIVMIIIVVISCALNYLCFSKITEFTNKYLYLRDGTVNLIIIVLPTTLTIISIALSLPKDLIYGLEKTEFRKLQGASKYSFLKMIFISMFIVVFFVYAAISNLTMVMPIVAIISMIYNICFLWQEIPLLMHNEKRIEKIIKKNIELGEKSENFNTVIQNMIFSKGLIYTYKIVEIKNCQEKNIENLNMLLDLQNFYFWRYIENYSFKNNVINIKYKNLNIIDAIDKAFENIKSLLECDSNFNLVKIFENQNYIYHLSELIISLKNVLEFLQTDNKRDAEFKKILNAISSTQTTKEALDEKAIFGYKLLNEIVVKTINNDELWFLEFIRDELMFSNRINNDFFEYFVFLSIYLYYLVEVEENILKAYKEKIKMFIKEKSKQCGLYSNSWESFMKIKLRFMHYNDYKDLLGKLLNIYNANEFDNFSYNFQKWGSYKRRLSKMFNQRFIINWWIDFMLVNDNVYRQTRNKSNISIIPEISDLHLSILTEEIRGKLNAEGKLDYKALITFSILFNIETIHITDMENSLIVKELLKFSKRKLYTELKNKIDSNKKTEEEINNYKEMIKLGFLNAVKLMPFLDQNLDLSYAETVYFPIAIEASNSELLIKNYNDNIPNSLLWIIYDYLFNKENLQSVKIKNYDEEILKQIIDFKPDYKLAYINDQHANENEKKLIKTINQIENLDIVWMPENLFIKKNAIRVNFKCVEENVTLLPPTNNEVNTIIDKNFRLINGFYKYSKYSNDKNALFLTREELFPLILNNYLFGQLTFKYKIKYEKEKILHYKID